MASTLNDLYSQRLSVTAAGFRIRRTNVPEADARGFYRQIGAAASHSLEVEAVGSIARGLAIRGGYSWTSTEITRDTGGFVGRELPNAPRHCRRPWLCALVNTTCATASPLITRQQGPH